MVIDIQHLAAQSRGYSIYWYEVLNPAWLSIRYGYRALIGLGGVTVVDKSNHIDEEEDR